MKDTRFIELVNLYVDRQISPAEQTELELEIQSHPGRRKVYQHYCRMHRATKLVYDSFRATSGEVGAPVRQPESLAHIAARARQRRVRWSYAASGLAAAACLTLVFALRSGPAASEGDRVLAAASTTPAAPAVVAAAPHETSADLVLRLPVNYRTAPHTLDESDYAMTVAALRAQQERLLNAQASRGGLSLFDDGVFEHPTSAPARAPSQLNQRRTPRAQAEFTAFQFQR